MGDYYIQYIYALCVWSTTEGVGVLGVWILDSEDWMDDGWMDGDWGAIVFWIVFVYRHVVLSVCGIDVLGDTGTTSVVELHLNLVRRYIGAC